MNSENTTKHYVLVSDFDQTLSFNDSGIVLSEMLGIHNFSDRIAGLSKIHLVQQGGELAYLILHDPDYRQVRKEHLVEVGKRIRLKQNIPSRPDLLTRHAALSAATLPIDASDSGIGARGAPKSDRLFA